MPEVSVASVVYNMAGDEADRPSYLKSLVVQNLFSRSQKPIGEAITNGLLKGPAMRLRSFYRWARDSGDYDLIGIPDGTLTVDQEVPDALFLSIITAEIIADPALDDLEAILETASGPPDPRWWAARWLAEDDPELLVGDSEDWTWDYTIDEAGENITIYPDGFSDPDEFHIISVTDPAYDSGDWYAYALYEAEPGIGDNVLRVWIYRHGDGNTTLDDLVGDPLDTGSFFPFIPVRLDNEFLSTTNNPSAYTQVTKAYKKAMGGAKLTELIEKLEDNESLDDIDHAYIVFGVSLNVDENECKKYLYAFFESLLPAQGGGVDGYDDWLGRGKTETPDNTLIMKGSTDVSESFDMRLSWQFVVERTGSGLGKVDAEVGELWLAKAGGVVDLDGINHEILRLYWQTGASTYTYLELIGMVHWNYVYGTSRVQISTWNAFDDTEDSGFIIPLHYNIWRSMSLVTTSQMATACVFIVFNCFQVYELQWYETFIFKILLVIVIAVVSVVFTGGAGIGLLGSALSLGTALGFTGLAAAIVGAVVNALAAMILISLLQPILDQAGPLGPVIAAVLMFAIGQASGSLTSTGSMVINWGDLLRVDNLLAMTNALGQGISNQINTDTLAIQQQALDYVDKAKAETNKIQQAFFDKFGYGAGVIDPLLLVDTFQGPMAESSDTFLARTLMTGSEIAEMSRELLYEFPKYSLKLPDAFT